MVWARAAPSATEKSCATTSTASRYVLKHAARLADAMPVTRHRECALRCRAARAPARAAARACCTGHAPPRARRPLRARGCHRAGLTADAAAAAGARARGGARALCGAARALRTRLRAAACARCARQAVAPASRRCVWPRIAPTAAACTKGALPRAAPAAAARARPPPPPACPAALRARALLRLRRRQTFGAWRVGAVSSASRALSTRRLEGASRCSSTEASCTTQSF